MSDGVLGPRVVWTPARDNLSLWQRASRVFRESETPGVRALRATIAQTGVPEVAGAKTPREDAIGLLQLAAEIEHALLVQYLYALLSVKAGPRRAIRTIATQEMGHLITVQNLLLALGGVNSDGIAAKVHFGRDRLRLNSPSNPLRFVLEGFGKTCAAKFLSIERPVVIEDQAIRERTEKFAELAVEDGFQPAPVGALYAKILWLLQEPGAPDEVLGLKADMGFRQGEHLKLEDFAPSGVVLEHASTLAEWENFPNLFVDVSTDLASARHAISRIIEQGEGMLQGSDSHFERFLDLMERVESGEINAQPIARSPFLAADYPAPEDARATPITDAYAQSWAELFNVRYGLMLLDFAWLMSLKMTDPRRAELARTLIKSMSAILGGLSDHLARMPLGTGDLAAGPPYQLHDDGSPDSLSVFRQRYEKLAQAGIAANGAIRASGQFQTCVGDVCEVQDFEGEDLLKAIADLDVARKPLLP